MSVRAILLFNNNTYAQATEIHTDRYTRRYILLRETGGIKGFPMASLKLSPGFAKVKYKIIGIVSKYSINAYKYFDI